PIKEYGFELVNVRDEETQQKQAKLLKSSVEAVIDELKSVVDKANGFKPNTEVVSAALEAVPTKSNLVNECEAQLPNTFTRFNFVMESIRSAFQKDFLTQSGRRADAFEAVELGYACYI